MAFKTMPGLAPARQGHSGERIRTLGDMRERRRLVEIRRHATALRLWAPWAWPLDTRRRKLGLPKATRAKSQPPRAIRSVPPLPLANRGSACPEV
jgi:hypothetical protein